MMLPYPVSVNRMYRNFRGRMVLSADGRAFKTAVAWLAASEGVRLIEGDVKVAVILHPKLTTKGKASKTRQDLDNLFKGLFDALNGVCWRDDSQVVSIRADIGEPMKNGGMTVEVEKFCNVK